MNTPTYTHPKYPKLSKIVHERCGGITIEMISLSRKNREEITRFFLRTKNIRI